MLRQRLRILLRQAQLYKQLEAANQALHQMANVDALTGLANRRRFNDYFNTQWINLVQMSAPLSLVLCDIDYFKLYNDKHGHPAGDICLQKVATALNEQVWRSQDLVARYGGEEFAVIMPNADTEAAFLVAEAMQAGVKGLKIRHSGSEASDFVTLSIGIASTFPTWETQPLDLIIAADQALYKAKEQGRNQIVVK